MKNFIENAVKTLQETDYTCCEYILDDNYAVYVGWLNGYDTNDTTAIHDKNDARYCINVGIKIRTSYFADYEYLDAPYFEDGEIFDTQITISPEEDYESLAKYLQDVYEKDLLRYDLTDEGMLIEKE